MRFFVKYKRLNERPTFDHLLQLWFNYHLVFFNYLMNNGSKLRAFNNFLKIKHGLKLAEEFDPSFVFLISLIRVTPSLTLRLVKRGNSIFEIPIPASYWKKILLACGWVIKLLKKNNRIFKVDKIIEILVLNLYNEGLAIEERDYVYFTAKVNRHLLLNKIFFR